MVAALAIVSVLVLGVASAMLVATRAVEPHTPPRATHAARLMRELEFATGFTERAAHAVTFTVADRNGDASEETIRFAWSGTAGDPLTRRYNAGTAVAVLDDVHECEWAYDLNVVTDEPDTERNESAEMLLASRQTAADPRDFEVQEARWIGQYLMPSLPAGAVSWRVTRVLIKARVDGYANDIAGVQLRLPTVAKLPSRTILEEVPMHEDRLTDWWLWHEFAFSNASGLNPSIGLCLTVVAISGDTGFCNVQYDGGGPSGMCQALAGESTWAVVPIKSMVFAVYGTVTTTSEPDPVTRTWVQGAGLRLRAGPDPSTAAETGVRLLNAPEVSN
jgi:hypothetical protein